MNGCVRGGLIGGCFVVAFLLEAFTFDASGDGDGGEAAGGGEPVPLVIDF